MNSENESETSFISKIQRLKELIDAAKNQTTQYLSIPVPWDFSMHQQPREKPHEKDAIASWWNKPDFKPLRFKDKLKLTLRL